MAETPDFKQTLYAFAGHIRDPDNVPAPEGIEERRMAVYRELFFNNIRNLLATMFPVIRKLHSDDKWHALIRQFMQHHRAETPYFLQLPQEFLAFLQNEYELQDDDYPFLLELAHYEYVELALSRRKSTILKASMSRATCCSRRRSSRSSHGFMRTSIPCIASRRTTRRPSLPSSQCLSRSTVVPTTVSASSS